LRSRCSFGNGVGLEIGYEITRLAKIGPSEVELDLGLGYTETNPFEQLSDSLRVAGSAREKPALSLCAASGVHTYAAVFVCARTGLFELQDVQAWDSTLVGAANSFSATGSLFQLGGVAGIALGKEPVLFTAQIGRMWRRFDAVNWKGDAQKALPVGLPRSLDLSGMGISFGINIQVKNSSINDQGESGSAAYTPYDSVRQGVIGLPPPSRD